MLERKIFTEWISVDEDLPNDGEEVIGMRADGWWDKCQWTESYGWLSRGMPQTIVKWIRAN